MRTLSILTAAAVGLAASISLAQAQATNVSPYSGTAEARYGSSPEPSGWRMSRSQRMRAHGHYATPYHHYDRPRGYYYRNTEGIPPAMYHAGDPQFWR